LRERIKAPAYNTRSLKPNLKDYEVCRQDFSWDQARALLDGQPGGGLNIAYEALDRHLLQGKGQVIALRWITKTGACEDFTYERLSALTNRFANLLTSYGLKKGGRVFSLLGRVPPLYITALGALKAGCVYSPLFSAFGPEPVQSRMTIGEGEVLVTTEALYRKKVAPWRSKLKSLKQVLLIERRDVELPPGTRDFWAEMEAAAEIFETVHTDPDDMALLHFTSGTTGKPKGAIHVHEAVVAHMMTGRFALDLHEGDRFWCTADPGWVTGTSYGIISPLVNRTLLLVDQGEFDPRRWYTLLQDQEVSVWYSAPTAIRMLMRAGSELVKEFDLSKLRFLASVGEPLNPKAVIWSAEVFGKPFHDNWWQTETGCIMIANFASMDVKPGSMGRPLPGIDAGIVKRAGESLQELTAPRQIGELALRPGWPSMMRGYLNEAERYAKCFVDGWYLTGDLAMRDEEGYYWFVGRADDMIKSSGHLIGPFEVESALLEHPMIAEAAVIGLPDETAGEVVKAYVTLKQGYALGDDLERELLAHARKRLGAAVAPREIVFRQDLPKTRSGKIMRRLLKARELGLPEGDTSTLEDKEE
jgi:acetyl-CoA synthetase